MNNSNIPPIVLDLVLIGGGHAHVHVLKMLGMEPYKTQFVQRNGIRITLIAKDIHTPYSGMLPGFVSGHYTFDEIHLDLRKLCRFSNIQLIPSACIQITYNHNNNNNSGGWIYCADGRPPIRYDCLSIDVGSAPGIVDQSLMEHPNVIPVKPIANFCHFYQQLQTKFQQKIINEQQEQQNNYDNNDKINVNNNDNNNNNNNNHHHHHRICVVGGGAGGMELALSIQYNLKQLLLASSTTLSSLSSSSSKNNDKNNNDTATTHNNNFELEMILVTRGDTFLPDYNSRVRKKMERILNERNIQVCLGCEVVGVADIQKNNNNKNENDDSDNSNKNQQQDQYHYKHELIVKDSPNGTTTTTTTTSTTTIPFDDCFVCTSAAGASWLSQYTPFECDSLGFIKVDATFQVINAPGVFAVGDCSSNIDYPRPKAGVYAVRAGPPLLENIIMYMTTMSTSTSTNNNNTILKRYKPQSNFLSLISTGDQYAIASKGSYLCLEGRYIWYLKDYIDRAFMDKYTNLPDMTTTTTTTTTSISPPPSLLLSQKKSSLTQQAFSGDPMRCGGCGAKVGSTSLSRVLKQLHQRQIQRAKEKNIPPPPPIDHDDAAIIPIVTLNMTMPSTSNNNDNNGNDHSSDTTTTAPAATAPAMIHTIDYFRSLIEDPYIFGKIVAVHALSDIHAMGAIPQTALSLAVIPFAANDAIVESTLLQLLAGMSDVLQDEKTTTTTTTLTTTNIIVDNNNNDNNNNNNNDGNNNNNNNDTIPSSSSNNTNTNNDPGVLTVGGHTCEGTELSCGLAIQGYTPNAQTLLLRKRGGQIGDLIILTKPIGTGALFAMDMRAKMKGEYWLQAISSMQQSNGPASRILMATMNAAAFAAATTTGDGDSNNDEDNDNNNNNNSLGGGCVHACTDVTGFGLIGHLLEMLLANDEYNNNNNNNIQNDNDNGNESKSDSLSSSSASIQQQKHQKHKRRLDTIGAKLYIHQIPFLQGGLEASAQGIYSSLQPQNIKSRRAVQNHVQAAKEQPIKYPLLFDPQTAGGLLIFVNPQYATKLLSELEKITTTTTGGAGAASIECAIIGELVAYTKEPQPQPAAVAAAASKATTTTTTSTGNDHDNTNDGDEFAVCSLSDPVGKRIEIVL